MLDSILQSFLLTFAWPAIGYLILGVFFGLWLGAVPGLAGVLGVIVILPFTFGMEPVSAIALILGVFAVTATSDSIASIMLGIPGTAAAQATVVDGYPMAKKGQAARAFGAAFSASAIGGTIGGIALALSLPIIRPLILSFGISEFFLLGAIGLTMVGTVSGRSVSKGLAAAMLGLMISLVGFPVASEEPRYWFDIQYLIDGFPLIPALLGLFALPELVELASRNTSIARVPPSSGGGLFRGVRDTLENWWLVLRCSTIGIYIGMLPGLGQMIADWVAYGYAVQSTRADRNPHFGQGDVRGVIAPESANNAVLGAALIPTVGLGIPGSGSMAVLLGAFVILGLSPGREMLTTHVDITFSMVWMVIAANIIGAGFLMAWSRQVAKISFIDGHLVVPAVFLFVLMGGWLDSPEIENWYCLIAFGLLGLIMAAGDWPRPPLVLGFLLGPVMENSLILSQQTFDLADVLSRPLFLALLALLCLAFWFAVRSMAKTRNGARQSASADTPDKLGSSTSLVFTVVCICCMVAAIFLALPWPFSAKLFPLVVAPVTLCALVAVVVTDLRILRRGTTTPAVSVFPWNRAFWSTSAGRSILATSWMVAIVALAPLVGQQVSIVAGVAFYLLVWGHYRLHWVALYAGASLALLQLLYGEILHVRWLEAALW